MASTTFVLFPVLTLIMNNTVTIDGMPENFFVKLFATMYIGMAPLTSIAAVIAEEKEKNTLRVLLMSNVKPHEYLLGIGCYIWLACMLGAGVICAAGGYEPRESLFFMAVMAAGILASLLMGAAIGSPYPAAGKAYILWINLFVFGAFFTAAYRRCGLE